MPTGQSSFLEASVTASPTSTTNIFEIPSHQFSAGEKVIVVSQTGDLPENIEDNTAEYVEILIIGLPIICPK